MSGLTVAGCISDLDEERPGATEQSSPISGGGWNQPYLGETYFMTMAYAAASAYPARFSTYTTTNASGVKVLGINPSFSVDSELTDETKVVTYIDSNNPPNGVRMIIAFRGTVHPTLTAPLSNWTDPGVDLLSQFVKVTHRNPFLMAPSDVGRVGGGWELRWRQVAVEMQEGNFMAFIKQLTRASRMSGEYLEINVVGHSLGAVVAELAALDIEEYMNLMGAHYEVNVVAFNPPKLGSPDLVEEYRRRLKERPDRFRISVFTREGDVVDDVPFDAQLLFLGTYHQVIDNVEYGNLSPLCSRYMTGTDNPLGGGPEHEAMRLPYAPRLHVTKPFPYGAHSIDDWIGKPGSVQYRQLSAVSGGLITPNGFRCMFAPDSSGRTQDTTAPQPQLDCSAYATQQMRDDCNPNPPPPGREEL